MHAIVRGEVILPRNEMKGAIPEYYFYQTLSLYFDPLPSPL